MQNIMFFMQHYWGILGVIVLIILYAIFDRQLVKRKAAEFIAIAEAYAQQLLLSTIDEKKQWVIDQYDVLPKAIKFFLTKDAWTSIVSQIINSIENTKIINKKITK